MSAAVIASEAKQSISALQKHRIVRRFAPRNDVERVHSVRFLRVGLFAGLHQIEALLDLAEQPREIAPFLRGEA